MPELPEVEVLARHLRPALRGKVIRQVQVLRAKVIRPSTPAELEHALTGAKFHSLARRGKYLLFTFQAHARNQVITVLGHLGMAGRMFVTRPDEPIPKHAAVVLKLNRGNFIYEDPRYFGRLTLDPSPIKKLGPEPWARDFSAAEFLRQLKRFRQAIKVKLLDQSLIAGVGNIYASEALFRARISPQLAANRFTPKQAERLLKAVREVLNEAIECGSTIPLNLSGGSKTDKLFYFGRTENAPDYYEERLLVYDRSGQPCSRCRTPIRRIIQAARSTFFCPSCQKR